MTRIGLDIDGVIADFAGYYLEKLHLDPALNTEWEVSKTYGMEVRNQVYDLVNDPATWVSLKPLPGAKDAVWKLLHAGLDPKFITSRPFKFRDLYEWWFGEHFDFYPNHLYIVEKSSEKPQIATSHGLTHYVDDRPLVAKGMADAGLESILVPTTYSGFPAPDGVVLETLTDFVDRVVRQYGTR